MYPAGFVYFYAWLRRVTGGAVAAAQPVFAVLYVLTLAVVLCVYVAAAVVPPWALPLLCLSKRLHSIYVLRLFNDPVAMLPAFAAVALAQRRRWCARCGVALQRTITLTCSHARQAGRRAGVERCRVREDERAAVCACAGAAHAAHGEHKHHHRGRQPCAGLAGTSRAGAGAALHVTAADDARAPRTQVALGAPFLATHPREYVSRSFDFGRRFEQRWSVNLQFLTEDAFLSRRTATALLAAHLALLAGAGAA